MAQMRALAGVLQFARSDIQRKDVETIEARAWGMMFHRGEPLPGRLPPIVFLECFWFLFDGWWGEQVTARGGRRGQRRPTNNHPKTGLDGSRGPYGDLPSLWSGRRRGAAFA